MSWVAISSLLWAILFYGVYKLYELDDNDSPKVPYFLSLIGWTVFIVYCFWHIWRG